MFYMLVNGKSVNDAFTHVAEGDAVMKLCSVDLECKTLLYHCLTIGLHDKAVIMVIAMVGCIIA